MSRFTRDSIFWSSFCALVGFAVPFAQAGTSSMQQPGCQPEWLPTFGQYPGTFKQYPQLPENVAALEVFDDGGGPALYAAGNFWYAGAVTAVCVAKWDGTRWSALGAGLYQGVASLAVFDDGSGAALYAGGDFTYTGVIAASRIAKWNGTTWSSVGGGVTGPVYSLAVFDDGSGPALYAGGSFASAGGIAAFNIAKWDGTTWSSVGGGVSGPFASVTSLAVFDDGGGASLYAGGTFSLAGGLGASRIAKWDGATWSSVGGGVSGVSSEVQSLEVFDDGSGAALYAGGNFTIAGGSAANCIARWNGINWTRLGGGLDNRARALTVFDDGSGASLVVGGDFTIAGGLAANSIAKWNGTSWSSFGDMGGTGNHRVRDLLSFDDGSGRDLFVAGDFMSAGGVAASHVAKWDGAGWSALGNGKVLSLNALAEFDDGSGTRLYAAGYLSAAGGAATDDVASWDGTNWSALPDGLEGEILALTAFDDGSGRALYAGGEFVTTGGVVANSIARWDGTNWAALGSGVAGRVTTLAALDDGSGLALYAAGIFSAAGGVPARNIAKWNGSTWSALGTGLSEYWNGGPVPPFIRSLAVFDDGSGTALFAGGTFTLAGSGLNSHLAKWDGTTWSAVSGFNGPVYALTVFEDGGGLAMYAGGAFSMAGGFTVYGLARRDGAGWHSVGGGIGGWVGALAVFDDGRGPALYAGGNISEAGGFAAHNIARWDGTNWSSLGHGVGPHVWNLAAIHEGSAAALYVGGAFGTSSSGDSRLAKWGNPPGCGAPGNSICVPGIGGVNACPCSNPPAGSGLGCNNSSSTGGAGLGATGIARLTYDTVVFTTQGECPTATSIVLQGDALDASGSVFGQGVRCVAGTLERLYVKTASAGSITAPEQPDDPVHERSAALGDSIAPGTHRYYGVYYRDPLVLGGCPATSTFSITQQLDVLWAN